MSSSAGSEIQAHLDSFHVEVSDGRRSLPAFSISGILVSFLGAILPAWGYHLNPDLGEVGEYFLSLYLGFLLSVAVGQWLLSRKGLKFTLILANALAALASFY